MLNEVESIPQWSSGTLAVEEQHKLKRSIIIKQAGRLFGKNGFHNTSLDDISGQIGVTKTSIYHYFKNKNEILLACFEVGFDIADYALQAAIDSHANGIDRLTAFVKSYTMLICQEPGACAAALEFKSLDDESALRVRAKQKVFDQKLKSLIAEGIADGSIANIHPSIVVGVVMGSITTLPRWYRSDGSVSNDELAQSLETMFKRMLASIAAP